VGLDYSWALDRAREGYSIEQIETMAIDALQEEDRKRMAEKILQLIDHYPLWEYAEHLSNQDTVDAFTEAGKRFVKEEKHRR
jgi:hypothetical protein